MRIDEVIIDPLLLQATAQAICTFARGPELHLNFDGVAGTPDCGMLATHFRERAGGADKCPIVSLAINPRGNVYIEDTELEPVTDSRVTNVLLIGYGCDSVVSVDALRNSAFAVTDAVVFAGHTAGNDAARLQKEGVCLHDARPILQSFAASGHPLAAAAAKLLEILDSD